MSKEQAKRNEIPLTIHALAHDGRGVADYNGKKVFVHGALVGEKVVAQVMKKHRRFLEARALTIDESAPSRVEAECAFFGDCGGCQLQHLPKPEQLKHKQSVVAELLQHHANTEPQEWLPPIVGDKSDYRTKARLGVRFDTKKEQLLIGFRELRSNKITRMNHCKVLDKRVGENLPAIQALIRAMSNFQAIPQIEVACSEDIVCLIFRHLEPFSADDIAQLKSFSQTHNYYIYLQPKGPDSVHLLHPIEGSTHLSLYHPEHKVELKFFPLDFTQVNLSVNQQMLNQAIQWLNPTSEDTILDLFCGLGNFTLPFARYAKWVTGVEGSIDMVHRGSDNAKHNHIENADFFDQDLFSPDWSTILPKRSFNKLILDPPRSGALQVVSEIEKIAPDSILYVSCNPITLARDTDILVNTKGYTLVKCGVLDMFPHTAHIESMTYFKRNDSPCR